MKINTFLKALAVVFFTVAWPATSVIAQTKVAFVTSLTTDGSITSGVLEGIPAADAICQSLATAQGLNSSNGPYRAWLSGSLTSPATTFVNASGHAYVRTDGTTIANNLSDLLDGTLAAPLNLTETMVGVGLATVWTGTATDGYPPANPLNGSCGDWQNTGVNPLSTVIGEAQDTDSRWTVFATGGNCTGARRLYCFQQDTGSTPVELQSFTVD